MTTESQKTEVQFKSVAKSFGNVKVLHDISLDIADGEFVVLLGPSGCGKTTLLRMTAGLESISSGDIFIGDKRVNEVHPRDRNIAMVFQNYALYPTMTVFDNIAFSLEVKKLAKEDIRKKVEEAAAILSLTDYLARYPKELSGGQRQRVAMGRAMVRDAEVFLFDEPLSNLDAKLRAHMRVEIRLLHGRLNATTIYVTHDQIEAMTMADKIVLMRDGNIEQIGTPDEVYDRPINIYVADFIGTPSMNFLPGEVINEKGVCSFATHGIAIPIRQNASLPPGQKLIAGIRPNDVQLSDNGPIKAILELAESTGAETQLHTRIETTGFVTLAPRGTKVTPGELLSFEVPADKIHLFDATTQQRIN